MRQLGGVRLLVKYMLAAAACARTIVRERSLRAADQRMSGQHWQLTVRGQTICVPGSSLGLARELYGRRPYFAYRGFDVARGDVVVDLGANIGLFSVLAARLGAQVVAVEAQKAELDMLRSVIAINGCGEAVRAVHAIVGGGTGVLSTWSPIDHGDYQPEVLQMHELITREALDRIDFLKVDIEGSEFALFRENHGWLSLVRRIAMEVHLQYGAADELRSQIGRDFETALMPGSDEAMGRQASGCYLFAWR